MLKNLEQWPRYRYPVLVLAALGGVLLSMFLTRETALNGWHQDRALQVSAMLNGLNGPAPEQTVTIIALDRNSMNSAVLKDVPRALMQPFIAEAIDAAMTGGARSLAIDLLLDFSARKYDPEGEERLRATLRQYDKQITLGRRGPQLPARTYIDRLAVSPAGHLGLMGFAADNDNVVRQVDLMHWPGVSRRKTPLPSLAGAALLRADVTNIPDTVTLAPTGHLTQIPTYSLADVITCARSDPTALAKAFFGKIIFIGATLPGEDRILTSARHLPGSQRVHSASTKTCLRRQPMIPSQDGSVPGVYVHAQAAAQVMNAVLPVSPSAVWLHLIAGAAALLSAMCVLLFRPQVAVPALTIFSLAGFALSIALLPDIWLPLGATLACMALTFVGTFGARVWFEQRNKVALADAFSRYVAPQLVDRIIDDRKHLERGGEMRDLSVWIADIANFTPMSEKMGPEQTAEMLNHIFGTMADIIEQHDGYVMQYAGDAIVAVFGAFGETPDHAEKAVTCAMASLQAVNTIGEELEDRIGTRISLRVGISSDRMLAGNIGSAKRLNFAIVGDGINLSARLESANKMYGTSILISDRTRQRCGDLLRFRLVDHLQVMGRETPLSVYEPLGLSADISDACLSNAEKFGNALQLYWDQRFDEAEVLFRGLAAHDPVARLFIRRIIEFRQQPPATDWDGVYVLKNK